MSARWTRRGYVWRIAVGEHTVSLFPHRGEWVMRIPLIWRGAWVQLTDQAATPRFRVLAERLQPYDADAAARVARLRGPRGAR